MLDAGCIFLLCMQTIALQQKYNSIGGANYESYRHRPPDRRPRPGRHPQGDPPHPPHPRGRPAADSIDTVGNLLLRNGRFSQTEWVEVVHNDENGSDDRRYSRGINNVTPPAKFDLSWRRCSSMGQSNKFKPSVLAPRGASTDGFAFFQLME